MFFCFRNLYAGVSGTRSVNLDEMPAGAAMGCVLVQDFLEDRQKVPDVCEFAQMLR